MRGEELITTSRALGISWVLDGFGMSYRFYSPNNFSQSSLEVTIVGVINGVLQDQRTLGLNG